MERRLIFVVFILFSLSFSVRDYPSIAKFPGGDRALYDFINLNYSRTEEFLNNEYFKRSAVRIKINSQGKASIID